MKTIESSWSYVDGEGETIMEKNECLFNELMRLKDSIGNSPITRMYCSKAWWEMNWSQVWVDLVFQPHQIAEHECSGIIKIASFHGKYDLYISEWFDDAKYWVMAVCEEGMARIIIKDFEHE